MSQNQDYANNTQTIMILELSVVGSALILTLALQILEVVTNRASIDHVSSTSAYYIVIASYALSFSLSFYSMITSSFLLILLTSIPLRQLKLAITHLDWWLVAPRVTTVASVLMLGVTALATSFLGNRTPVALTAALIIGFGLTATVLSSFRIMKVARHIPAGDNDALSIPGEVRRPVSVQKLTTTSLVSPQTLLSPINTSPSLATQTQTRQISF